MQDVLVYPFSEEFMPILRHKKLIKDFKVSYLVSPYSFGISNFKLEEVDGGSYSPEFDGLNIKIDFQSEILKCDAVWFVPFSRSMEPMKNLIKENLELAIENKKDIFWSLGFDLINVDKYKKLASDKNLEFRIIGNTGKYEKSYKRKLEIPVPVILVMGDCEETNKFEIELSLKENIEAKGYKATLIGSREYSGVVNGYPYPNLMFENIKEVEKVIKFNNYVFDCVSEDLSDIVIIGVPGGIRELNDYINNEFGILAYEVASSVDADIAICSLLCQDIDNNTLNELKNIFKYKFNCNLDYINISNNAFNLDGAFIIDKFKILNCDYNVYLEIKKELKSKVYNVLYEDDSIILTNDIIDRLSS